eukprot:g2752.t1
MPQVAADLKPSLLHRAVRICPCSAVSLQTCVCLAVGLVGYASLGNLVELDAFKGQPNHHPFRFAHCHKDGTCVLTGILLFFLSLAVCSLFGWACQDWITDPLRNPFARRADQMATIAGSPPEAKSEDDFVGFSFSIMVDAATWIPISVAVGKTNALVEWFMDVAQDNLAQVLPAPLLRLSDWRTLVSSCLAALLTFSCAVLTHLAMKYCRGVADTKGEGLRGFLRFFLLATITCLGWAVAWSNWELVLSLMDALEPDRPDHDLTLVRVVIAVCLVLSICFYLRFGPEPIIPDPQLQHLCYAQGYSSSVQRSFVSYIVYSCVVCMVMVCCDPNYGLLIALASWVYSSTSSMFDAQALFVLCSLAVLVTLLSALCSAGITWAFEVDALTSMRLSRSVNDACAKMVNRRRSQFGEMLSQVQKAGSDACLMEVRVMDVKEAHGPRCLYKSMSDEEALSEVESERQLRLNPGSISSTICASVLVYDVLGFVVCFQWGMLVVRGYSVVFGRIAARHTAFYIGSCLIYASAVVVAISRLVFCLFPSAEERLAAEVLQETSSRRIESRLSLWRDAPQGSAESCQELSQNLTPEPGNA